MEYQKITNIVLVYLYLQLLILSDSVVKVDHHYHYLQIFLEEPRYAIKQKKIKNKINEELKLRESDDDEFDEY